MALASLGRVREEWVQALERGWAIIMSYEVEQLSDPECSCSLCM